jgi:hypothetical protein
MKLISNFNIDFLSNESSYKISVHDMKIELKTIYKNNTVVF